MSKIFDRAMQLVHSLEDKELERLMELNDDEFRREISKLMLNSFTSKVKH